MGYSTLSAVIRCLVLMALVCAGPLRAVEAGDSPQPPDAEKITEWLRFDRSCPLQENGFYDGGSFKPNHIYRQLGELVWVALYQGGTHLTPAHRDKIAQRAAELDKKSKDQPQASESILIRPRVFTLDDGRSGYHTLLIYGPGGAMTGTSVSSKNGQFDLVVLLFHTLEDDAPEDERLKNSALLRVDPPDLLKAVDVALFN